MTPRQVTPSLGARIRSAREGAGLTREQLAARIGVNWRTLARYESDETQRITFEMLFEIAAATGKPIAYFVDREQAA